MSPLLKGQGTSKKCSRCKLELSSDKFLKDSGKQSGLTSHCRDCKKKQRLSEQGRKRSTNYYSSKRYKELKKKHNQKPEIKKRIAEYAKTEKSLSAGRAHRSRPEVKESIKIWAKRYSLKKQYGLTLEEHQSMVTAQKSCCKICHRPAKLHVDHDHNTGKVRGLLCLSCNMALGLMKDNTEVLSNAIKYLQN